MQRLRPRCSPALLSFAAFCRNQTNPFYRRNTEVEPSSSPPPRFVLGSPPVHLPWSRSTPTSIRFSQEEYRDRSEFDPPPRFVLGSTSCATCLCHRWFPVE